MKTPPDSDLSLAELREIDRRCEAFEDAIRNGPPPNLSGYLAGLTDRAQQRLAEELAILKREVKAPVRPGEQTLARYLDRPALTSMEVARIIAQLARQAHHRPDSLPSDPGRILLDAASGCLMPVGQEVKDAAPATVAALGRIMYQLLTGHRPRSVNPVAPHLLDAAIPVSLSEIALASLEQRRVAKYSTFLDFAADLQRYLDGRPVLAAAMSPLQRVRRFVSRGRIAFAMVAIVGVVIAAMVLLRRIDDARERLRAELEGSFAYSQSQATDQLRQASVEQARLEQAIGCALAESGDVNGGLSHLMTALEISERAQTSELVRSVRINLRAWKSVQPNILRRWKLGQPPTEMAWHADGRSLVLLGPLGTLRLLDSESNQEPVDLPCKSVSTFALSVDGSVLMTASAKGEIGVWDWNAGRPQLRYQDPGAGEPPTALFSFSGGTNVGMTTRSSARVWDVAARQIRGAAQAVPAGARVVWTPDGLRMASISGTTLKVRARKNAADFDWRDESMMTLPRSAISAQFASDRETLLVLDESRSLLEVNVRQGSVLHRFSGSPESFAPAARFVITGSRGGILSAADVSTSTAWGGSLALPAAISTITVHPSGRMAMVGCADGHLFLCSLARRLQPDDPSDRGAPPTRLGISSLSPTRIPAGLKGALGCSAVLDSARLAVIGTIDGRVWLWDLAAERADGEPWNMTGPVTAVAIRPDGGTVLSASGQTVAVRRVATKDVVFELTVAEAIQRAAFSPDGRLLALGLFDGSIRVFDAVHGWPLGPTLRQPGPIIDLTWSADGAIIFAKSASGVEHRWLAAGPPIEGTLPAVKRWLYDGVGK